MEVSTHFSKETIRKAVALLADDMEMLHDFGSSAICVHCGAFKRTAEKFAECPALLRVALNFASARNGDSSV